ncbi:hypothetical protein [Nocardia africana]|uniref:Uncharacterized protein n=1 Tax=Nocardia africana TaxID=134964 RepID=A0ABW6NGY8_9NOCA
MTDSSVDRGGRSGDNEPMGRKVRWGADEFDTTLIGWAVLAVVGAIGMCLIMIHLYRSENVNHGGTGGELSCPHGPNRCTATFDRRVDQAEVVFHGDHVRLVAVEGDAATLELHAGLMTFSTRLHNGESGSLGDEDDPNVRLDKLELSGDDVIVELYAWTLHSVFN